MKNYKKSLRRKGQKVLFKAIDPTFEERQRERVKKAVDNINNFSKNFRTSKGISASKWLIDERDKMQESQYYD